MRTLAAAPLVALALFAAACAPGLPASYTCATSSQCSSHGVAGICEPTGACSFPDPSCAGGSRYGDLGPPSLAGVCVGDVVTGGGDGGGDGGGNNSDGGAGGVPITRVGTASLPAAAHTTVSLTPPAGLAAGDLLFASIFVASSNATITPPSGWTQHQNLSGGVTADFRAAWFYRITTAAEPARYDFTLGGQQQSAGGLVAYRGVAPASPIDAATNQTFQGAAFTAPSITTTHAGAMLLAMFVDGSSTTLTWNPPAGMQTAVDANPIGMFDALQPVAGPSGAKTATMGIPVGVGAVDYVALTPR